MTIAKKLIDAVSARPGRSAGELADRLSINASTAPSALLSLCHAGVIHRRRIVGDDLIARWAYFPGKSAQAPSIKSALILKSRGFPGVDIDACHRGRP